MNRAEHLRMLATEPATRNQLGAIRAEFGRLGLDGDRPGRLAAAAALLGLGSLGSVRDLSMGQAGHLVKTLRGLAGAGQLAAACQARAGARGPTRGELAAAFAGWQQMTRHGARQTGVNPKKTPWDNLSAEVQPRTLTPGL